MNPIEEESNRNLPQNRERQGYDSRSQKGQGRREVDRHSAIHAPDAHTQLM